MLSKLCFAFAWRTRATVWNCFAISASRYYGHWLDSDPLQKQKPFHTVALVLSEKYLDHLLVFLTRPCAKVFQMFGCFWLSRCPWCILFRCWSMGLLWYYGSTVWIFLRRSINLRCSVIFSTFGAIRVRLLGVWCILSNHRQTYPLSIFLASV